MKCSRCEKHVSMSPDEAATVERRAEPWICETCDAYIARATLLRRRRQAFNRLDATLREMARREGKELTE